MCNCTLNCRAGPLGGQSNPLKQKSFQPVPESGQEFGDHKDQEVTQLLHCILGKGDKSESIPLSAYTNKFNLVLLDGFYHKFASFETAKNLCFLCSS